MRFRTSLLEEKSLTVSVTVAVGTVVIPPLVRVVIK